MTLLKRIVSTARNVGAAKAFELLFYIAAGVWLIATAGAEAYVLGTQHPNGVEIVALLTGGVLVGAVGVTFFAALAELSGQRARDLRAQHIFDMLQRGETPPPYALYLRPFQSTGAISEQVYSGTGFTTETVELESQIERATRAVGPLVALGKPLEFTGAGRIEVADNVWQDAIKVLLEKAKLIVMLPSSHAGTLHEIDMILSSPLMAHTVLVDSPNLTGGRFDQTAEWAGVQKAFEQRGFELPRDSRAGALLFYGEQRTPKLSEKLDIDAEDRIERLFRRVIRDRNLAA